MLVESKVVPEKLSYADGSPDLSYLMAYNSAEKGNFVYLWKLKEPPLDTGKMTAVELYRRACELLRYQPDQYSSVKKECDSPLAK